LPTIGEIHHQNPTAASLPLKHHEHRARGIRTKHKGGIPMRHHGALALCCLVASAISSSAPAIAKNSTRASNPLPPATHLIVAEQTDGFVIKANSNGFSCTATTAEPAVRLGSSVRFDPRIAPALPTMLITEEVRNVPLH
jgi:hypothetical protein